MKTRLFLFAFALLTISFNSCVKKEILYHTKLSILAEPNNPNEVIQCNTPYFETNYFRGSYRLDTKNISFNFMNKTSETFYIIFNEGIIIYPEGDMEYIVGADRASKTLTTNTTAVNWANFGVVSATSESTRTVNQQLKAVPCLPQTDMNFRIIGNMRAQRDDDDADCLIYQERGKLQKLLYNNATVNLGKNLVVSLPMIIGGERVVYNFYLKIEDLSLE